MRCLAAINHQNFPQTKLFSESRLSNFSAISLILETNKQLLSDSKILILLFPWPPNILRTSLFLDVTIEAILAHLKTMVLDDNCRVTMQLSVRSLITPSCVVESKPQRLVLSL